MYFFKNEHWCTVSVNLCWIKKSNYKLFPVEYYRGCPKKKDWLHARFDTVRWLMKQIETKLSGQPS